MGFSSQKFCTERFLFRGNIDCIFLHNNSIKNINYLPKTVNQTRYSILFSYLLDFSRSLCKGAPQKVNEWWKNFFSCPIIIFSLQEERHQAAGARGHHHLSIQANHTWHPACLCSSSSKKGAWGHKFSLNFGVVFVVIFSPTNNNRVTAVIQQREDQQATHMYM